MNDYMMEDFAERQPTEIEDTDMVLRAKAFKNTFQTWVNKASLVRITIPPDVILGYTVEIRDILQNTQGEFDNFAWNITLQISFEKQNPDGSEKIETGFFHSKMTHVDQSTDLSIDYVYEAMVPVITSIDKWTRQGSGWTVRGVLGFFLSIRKVARTRGGSYLPTPPYLEKKKAIINIINEGGKCKNAKCIGMSRSSICTDNTHDGFSPDENCPKWSIIAHLFPCKQTLTKAGKLKDDHSDRWKQYREHENKLNWSGLSFPLPICENMFKTWEKNNPGYGLYVYKYEALTADGNPNYIYPIYTCKQNIPERSSSCTWLACSTMKDKGICNDRSHAGWQPSKRIRLMTFDDGNGKSHMTLIRNMSRLFYDQNDKNDTHFPCDFCCTSFYSLEKVIAHEQVCSVNGGQRVSYPKKGGICRNKECISKTKPITACTDKTHYGYREGNKLKYTAVSKQLRKPFKYILDCECSMVSEEEMPEMKPNGSWTIRRQKHVVNSVCWRRHCEEVPAYSSEPKVFYGKTAMQDAIDALILDAGDVQKILTHKQIHTYDLTVAQRKQWNAATKCHICGEEGYIKDDPIKAKVVDHNHMTGEYRGAAHKNCNWKYAIKPESFIPVIAHNMRGYDSHQILAHTKIPDWMKLECIPDNMEKYKSFSVGVLRFIDSMQFQMGSLEQLVANVKRSTNGKALATTRNYCERRALSELGGGVDAIKLEKRTEEIFSILSEKGVYPYEWMTNDFKFNYIRYPPLSAFHTSLGGNCSVEDYADGQHAWNVLHCQVFKDYHEAYLISDVLLLTDYWNTFTDMCLEYYGLDPNHYYTAPGMAWDAMLKKTGVELELITEENADMFLFFESALKGGICMISCRYARSNHQALGKYYEPDKKNSFIIPLDANNLYGWAMSQSLPSGNFEWVIQDKIDALNEWICMNNNLGIKLDVLDWSPYNIMKLDDNAARGCGIECDIRVPAHLHDLFNDYPLAPEQLICKDLSPYNQELAKRHNVPPDKIAKLTPNLKDKFHYKVHYRNLKLYVSLGLIITKVHRIIEFDQSKWMKPYVDFNTVMRLKATKDKNSLLKDYFKLMNNSVFGKCMEKVRSRINVKLVNSAEKAARYTQRYGCVRDVIMNENLVAIHCPKTELTLAQPIYVGLAILDLSKLLMYDFHYNVMMPKYGPEKCKLLMTDTDSLIYWIQTEDVYEDFKSIRHHLDTSGYPKDNPLYSADEILTNMMVMGKFKDESNGKWILEFVGLRCKMYSYIYVDGVCDQDGYSCMDMHKKQKCMNHDHPGWTNKGKKTGKGISKGLLSDSLPNSIKHEHYKQILDSGDIMRHVMNKIRSYKHETYTSTYNKISLGALDSKRWVRANHIDSYAIGHWRCKLPE